MPRVRIVSLADRPNLVFRWKDSTTGGDRQRDAGTPNRRHAERGRAGSSTS